MREAARKTREATSACGNGKRGAGAALWEYQYGGGPVDHEKRRVGRQVSPENGIGTVHRKLTHKQLVIFQAIYDGADRYLPYKMAWRPCEWNGDA